MKKRIISILLSLCLVLPLLPTLSATATTTQKPWDQSPGDWTALTEEYLQTVGYKISGGCYYLDADVTLPKTLVVTGASATDKNVTLDLNGHVLKYNSTTKGSVIEVQPVQVHQALPGGVGKVDNYPTHFVLQDSAPDTPHYFTKETTGLWTLSNAATDNVVSGGVITGGTGRVDNGVAHGGGIYILGVDGSAEKVTAVMTGGNIVGCTANRGGGVYVAKNASFTMSGSAQIRGCTATTRDTDPDINPVSGEGGGIDNRGTLTLLDSAYIADCTAAEATSCAIHSVNGGGNSGTICAEGGEVHGTVYSGGDISSSQSKITRSETSPAVTKFYGDVTNQRSIIESGIFYGTVTNEAYQFIDPNIAEEPQTDYGKITGGTFYGDVTGGAISGGIFYGAVSDCMIESSAQVFVTFDCNYAGGTTTTQPVLKGQKVKAPKDPTRDGRSFVGWYTDSDCNTAFDFSTAITENITLYAKWTCAEHTGGKATCTEKAVCTVCGKEYGELDPDNHTGKEIWTKLVREHQKAWDCCDHATVDFEPHEWKNGVCKECGYVCLHPVGSDATCKEQSVCYICGEKFDKIDSNNHEGKAVWTTTETTHEKVWDCCGEVAVESEAHEWKNGVCSECGYVCQHKGGKADCSHKAVCTLCGSEYGELGDTHVGKETWVSDSKTHTKKWDCCGAEIIPETAHEFDENGDCVCGAREFIFGDANGDGKVDSSDVILLKKYIANYDPETGSSSVELCRGADMNGDGKIDSRDIILIKKYIANYTPETTK